MVSCCFILVETQLAENLGGVARALSNFGCHDLRLVACSVPINDSKAIAVSAHGYPVLAQAKHFSTLNEAVADCTRVFGTTSFYRNMIQSYSNPKSWIQTIVPSLSGTIALVFGCERTGLLNQHLAQCTDIISIPVDDKNPSLNLVQAVTILAYEWFNKNIEPLNHISLGKTFPAQAHEIDRLLQDLEKNLDQANYWRVPSKKALMLQMVHTIFHRMNLSHQEAQSLHGLIRALNQDPLKN